MPIELTSNLLPRNGNTFSLLEDIYVKGGLKVVADSAALTLLHSSTLKHGMLAILQDTGALLKYDHNVGLWEPFSIQTSEAVSVLDHGDITAPTLAVNVGLAKMQRFKVLNTLHITFAGWPESGTLGELTLEIENAGINLNFPTSILWIKGDGSFTSDFGELYTTLQLPGIDFITMWSRNGGTNVYAKVLR